MESNHSLPEESGCSTIELPNLTHFVGVAGVMPLTLKDRAGSSPATASGVPIAHRFSI